MYFMKKREAAELGLDRYNTGKPCVNGHHADRITKSGNCVECIKMRDSAKRDDYPLLMWRQKKAHAKRLGREYTIQPSDIAVPDKCPALGITIDPTGKLGHDHLPSIDRIDNIGGYVPGNVCVISGKANRLKRDATADELRLLLEYMSNAT